MTRDSRHPVAVRFALIVVAFVLALPSAAARQADPPFAGRWVLVSAKPVRPGFDQFWLGTEAEVGQTATTIEITRGAPAPARRATFVLGKETRNVYTLGGQEVVHDSRATIRDGVLIISTETTAGAEMRRLSHIMRWSLDPDGMLTVTDTQICGHGECPSIVTTLRFQKNRVSQETRFLPIAYSALSVRMKI